MKFELNLSKMASIYEEPIVYLLRGDKDFFRVNDFLGRQITMVFLNEKYCSACGNKVADLFRMGFCKKCFFESPKAGESIIRPELSKAHLGEEDRDIEFEKSYQLQRHVVYLANGGALKVGVTRANQKIHRWIDQGASDAAVLARTENRYQAGLIEVALKQHVAEKTPWRKMLTNQIEDINLLEERKRLQEFIPNELQKYYLKESETVHLEYPVKEYPTKLKSLNLDKDSEIEARLEGVRGQYWIFDNGRVLNIRAHSGYRVALAF